MNRRVATPAMPYAQIIAPLMLTGAGTSCAMPAVQRVTVNAVSRADVGKASGTFTMLTAIAGTVIF